MKRKVCFMFVSASITDTIRTEMEYGPGLMIVIGVKNYQVACEEAVKVADEGVILLELCGGFGTVGHAMVTQAVKGKCQVGVVRFDNHPGFDGDTGDSRFL
ncbi:MAG TPA: DUF6506 family protein [Bacillota bacterium]|nr:DUF6506 family protein [Bacillota bacterium]